MNKTGELRRARVAAVVLNWNRRERLITCVESLRAMDYPPEKIIVVDNASTDGSAEAVRSLFPDASLIVNDRNYGAIGGKNIGLKAALGMDVEYIYMVDNDILVGPASLAELVSIAEADPRAGLVGTKMYDNEKKDVLLSAGGIIDFTENVGRGRGDGEKDTGQYDRVEEVDYLWGGALLARKTVLEKVGLFDPGYVGYWFEDTDLSVRVRKAGYKVVFCPSAVVWHQPHAAAEQFSFRKKYLAARNAVRFMKKHATFANWAKYLLFAVGGLPYAAARDLVLRGNMKGAWGKTLGLLDGFLNLKDRTAKE